jgi:hypothetical protein
MNLATKTLLTAAAALGGVLFYWIGDYERRTDTLRGLPPFQQPDYPPGLNEHTGARIIPYTRGQR